MPLRHQSKAEEKDWRAKLKTAAQASNQSYCSTFLAQDGGSTVTVGGEKAGNSTGNESEMKKRFYVARPTLSMLHS